MRAPERYPSHEAVDARQTSVQARPATPTVYPEDDHVREGLLGPDGKPLTNGTRRKHPIGSHKQDHP